MSQAIKWILLQLDGNGFQTMRIIKQDINFKRLIPSHILSRTFVWSLRNMKRLFLSLLFLLASSSLATAQSSRLHSVDQALPTLIKGGEPVSKAQAWYKAHVDQGHYSSSFNQKGDLLALTSLGNPIEIWNISNRKLVTTLSGGGRFGKSAFVDISPNGKMLASGMDGRIELRKLGNKDILFSVPVIDGGLSTLSNDGRYLATAIDGKRLDLWDTRLEQRIHSFAGEYVHKEPITALKFSYDGRYLVSADRGGTFKVWDIIEKRFMYEDKKHRGPIQSLVFSDNSKQFVTVDTSGVSKLWGIERAELLHTMSQASGKVGSFTSAVAFSPNGRQVVVALNGSKDKVQTKIFDTTTGEVLFSLNPLYTPVSNLSFSADNRSVVFSFNNKVIKVFDIRGRSFTETFGGQLQKAKKARVSPDGGLIAAGTVDGVMQLWDLRSKKLRYSLKGRNKSLESVAFSLDGRFIIAGDSTGKVSVWNRNNNQSVLEVDVHKKGTALVAMSADNKYLVTSSTESSVLKLWDMNTKKIMHKFLGHHGTITALIYSRDGKRIISASKDGTVKLWDVKERRVSHTFSEGEKSKHFTSLDLSRDGRYLAAGIDAGNADIHGVEIWDLESLEHSHRLSDHFKKVTSVRLSPDGKKLASGSEDGTIKIWSFQAGELLASLQKKEIEGKALSPISSVDFSKDGKSIISVSDDGAIDTWIIANKKLEYTMLGGPRGTWISENHIKRRFWRGDDGTLIVTTKGRNSSPAPIAPATLATKDSLVLTASKDIVEIRESGGKFRITVKNNGKKPSFWIQVEQKNKNKTPVTLLPNKLTRLAAGQTGILDLKLKAHNLHKVNQKKNMNLQLELVTKAGSRFPINVPLKFIESIGQEHGRRSNNEHKASR